MKSLLNDLIPLLPLLVAEALMVPLGLSNLSLGGNYRISPDIIAYGRIWVFLNPWYWTQQPYKLYLFGVEMASFAFQFWLYRRGTLGYKWLYMGQLSSVILWLLSANQNVTILMFAPLASISPLAWVSVVAFEVFQKMAFGWTWVPWASNNLHWQCETGQLAQFPAADCNSFFWHIWKPAAEIWSAYPLLAFWVIAPIWYQAQKVWWWLNPWKLTQYILSRIATGTLL